MSEKLIRCIEFPFYGAGGPPAAGSPNGTPFCKRDTSAAGSPTILGVNGGGWALALDATSEAEIIGFDMNDILAFDIDELVRVEFQAKIDATPGSAVNAVMGMAGAYNATLDSVAQNAWFKFVSSSLTPVCETDDGTNDNDDKSTGVACVADTWKRFAIEFAAGSLTRQPPSASLGGTANIMFYMGDTNGNLKRVATSTNFDMSNYTSGLQPYFQLQKASGTSAAVLSVKNLKITVKD